MPRPLAIECNAHLVVPALVNTLVNALHHGQTGGEVMVCTELLKWPSQSMAVLCIRNPEDKAPSHKLIRGSGLGLSFVRMVTERHGGGMTASWWDTQASVTVESTSATLRLEIPIWNWARSFKIPQSPAEGLSFPLKNFWQISTKKQKFITKLLLTKICYT